MRRSRFHFIIIKDYEKYYLTSLLKSTSKNNLFIFFHIINMNDVALESPMDLDTRDNLSKRGRKKKYETNEERDKARLAQCRESYERRRIQRNEVKSKMTYQQKFLIRELKNTVLTEEQATELYNQLHKA
jgi:hypothetical protein